MSKLPFKVLIIFNIPQSFGSADLRRFFSDFVETEKFLCFHYKRRPEIKLPKFDRKDFLKAEEGINDQPSTSNSDSVSFFCCPVKLREKNAESFIDRFNNTHWTDEDGVDLDYKCFITTGCASHHWTGLEESNPPSVFPRGNVGTCTQYLMDAISACKLPPSIIKRLKLNFHERRRRAYATVPLSYQKVKGHKSYYVPSTETIVAKTPLSSAPKTEDASDKSANLSASDITSPKDEDLKKKMKGKKRKSSFGENSKEPETVPHPTGSDDDIDEAETEEWDRHRTLHNDVSARRQLAHPDDIEFQEGTKERRYEERMEVTWEKGGSGLVFYTDEQFWREQGQDDSDEADDWDVDMEGYEVDVGGDKDNRDAMDMFYNDDVREGRVSTSAFKKTKKKRVPGKTVIGDFERHTRGVGRKLMEKQGWRDGSGLGSKLAGISNPIEARGTSDRLGLGYRESEPGTSFTRPVPSTSKSHSCKSNSTKSGRTFHISTVYDKKE